MDKREYFIIEANLYTDGDWGTKCGLFEGYTSRFFEQDYYEFTDIEGYSIKFRRVFDTRNKALDFISQFQDSIHGRDYETNVIKSICEHIKIALKYEQDRYDGEISGNSEGTLSFIANYSDVRPIKEIIYED